MTKGFQKYQTSGNFAVPNDWSLRVFTHFSIIFYVAINFFLFYFLLLLLVPFHSNLSHINALGNFLLKNDLNRKTLGPQLLNMLLWNYNPQATELTAQHNKWQNIINFNLFFRFSQGDDKFSFEECGQFILLFLFEPNRRLKAKSLRRLLHCSQNPLIKDSKSLSYFVLFVFLKLSHLPHRSIVCLLFDKWLI